IGVAQCHGDIGREVDAVGLLTLPYLERKGLARPLLECAFEERVPVLFLEVEIADEAADLRREADITGSGRQPVERLQPGDVAPLRHRNRVVAVYEGSFGVQEDLVRRGEEQEPDGAAEPANLNL